MLILLLVHENCQFLVQVLHVATHLLELRSVVIFYFCELLLKVLLELMQFVAELEHLFLFQLLDHFVLMLDLFLELPDLLANLIALELKPAFAAVILEVLGVDLRLASMLFRFRRIGILGLAPVNASVRLLVCPGLVGVVRRVRVLGLVRIL